MIMINFVESEFLIFAKIFFVIPPSVVTSKLR